MGGFKDALTGATKGGMTGIMTGNPYVAMGSAIAGGVGGYLSPGDGGKEALPIAADPTSVHEAITSPTPSRYESMAVGRGLSQAETPYMDLQRQLGGWQQEDLQTLFNRAQGRDLLSTRQGLEQQRALQAATMGQAASARGRYNPSLQNVAMSQAGMVPAQMSAGLRAAQEQEKMAALQAYNQGVSQFREQGQGAMQAWDARQAMERQRQMDIEQQRQAMLKFSQQAEMNKIANRAATEAIRTGVAGRGDKWATAMGQDPYQKDKFLQYEPPEDYDPRPRDPFGRVVDEEGNRV